MNQCPNCKTPVGSPDFKAHRTYLWANQHGDCIRIFCSVCGQWTDVTYTHKLLGEIVEVRKNPTRFYEQTTPRDQTEEFYAAMDEYFSEGGEP